MSCCGPLNETPSNSLAPGLARNDLLRHTGHLMSLPPRSADPVAPGLRDSITTEYLKRILTARVYDVAIESPLELAQNLSQRVNNLVYLKREDQQPVFSFKLRGAYNKMVRLSPEERERGVIAASAGNHAQGVALAARRLGCRATIVMPVTTPALKIEAVRALGAEVVLVGTSYSDAYEHAVGLEATSGATF